MIREEFSSHGEEKRKLNSAKCTCEKRKEKEKKTHVYAHQMIFAILV